MNLSVAYGFQSGVLEKLARFPQVKEVYGCIPGGAIGSGRSAYTLPRVSRAALRRAVSTAHGGGMAFNYLLNAASLYGMEQTRTGERAIRRTLDDLIDFKVDAVTVAVPLLLRIIKKHYPKLRVRVGAFALIDSPTKAKAWENLGADTLCISAIAANRDFDLLYALRSSVSCDLELIANASCLPGCIWEQTHMHVLSQSSTKKHGLKGFCFDYCFVQCSRERLSDPTRYIRSIWIRPEDLEIYEDLGYRHFKIVERSCPPELLLKRVAAYCNRTFDGNLWELTAPVAWIKNEQRVPKPALARMVALMLRPWLIKTSAMFDMKKFAETVIPHDFSRERSEVYIDNRALDGFLKGLRSRAFLCRTNRCGDCSYCRSWTEKAVVAGESWREAALASAERLDEGIVSGAHWGLQSGISGEHQRRVMAPKSE
jgi:collagenase-like PrtC family protease